MRTSLITVDEIMAWNPCENWPRERVASVIGEGKTFEQVITDLNLNDEELEWFILREDIFTVDELRSFIHVCICTCEYTDCESCPCNCTVQENGTCQPYHKWPDVNGGVFAFRRARPSLAANMLRTIYGGNS